MSMYGVFRVHLFTCCVVFNYIVPLSVEIYCAYCNIHYRAVDEQNPTEVIDGRYLNFSEVNEVRG